jgi:hypothetical protein
MLLNNLEKHRILSEHEYFSTIADRIATTVRGDRVLMTTMGFDPSEPPIARIMDELIAAGKRGATVALGVDAYTFMIDDKTSKVGPLFYCHTLATSKGLNETFRNRLEVLEALGETPGGTYAITNKPGRPFTNPFAGRSHIKIGLVNDEIFIGGCNLFFSEKNDAMVGWKDAQTANWIYSEVMNIFEEGNASVALGEDKIFEVDPHTSLLIDAGFKNQSIIYSKALQVIDDARESLTLVCQYLPGGEVGDHLYDAYKRGVDVKAYHNDASKYASVSRMWQRASAMRESRRLGATRIVTSLPKEHPMIHYKILTSEASSMIGSHNYLDRGVKWATAEATLLRHDPKFARQVGRFIAEHVRP